MTGPQPGAPRARSPPDTAGAGRVVPLPAHSRRPGTRVWHTPRPATSLSAGGCPTNLGIGSADHVFEAGGPPLPTATNKMYNADLTEQGIGGKLQDFSQQDAHGDGSGKAKHFSVVRALLDALDSEREFEYPAPITHKVTSYRVRYGVVDPRIVVGPS